MDVDGVMTDGRIVFDSNGIESKFFHVRDGHGIKLVQRAGIEVGIISGRQSAVVDKRAAELGIRIVHQKVIDKIIPYRQILRDTGLDDSHVAYIGDDLVDIPILRRVGFSAAPADAAPEVLEYVHLVTRSRGGHGAVREVCDQLLKGTGAWEDIIGKYFR
jgi:3-deoxy-D-manno-octulosonate 8-phosphate phosphatase (KDO 8-P phosphatase)